MKGFLSMSVKFNIVERGNPSNPQAPKKFYPSIQSSGRMTLRELAKGNIVELGDSAVSGSEPKPKVLKRRTMSVRSRSQACFHASTQARNSSVL
jgi:hypothetical protein